METLTNSRFITWPSIVDRTTSHTVILVDAEQPEIDQISEFCSVCDKNYDIYLYTGDSGDLEYLNAISDRSDLFLINNLSKVTTTAKNVRYGAGLEYTSAVDYFVKYDQIN